MSTVPINSTAKYDYTALVCMRGDSPGKLSAIRQEPCEWGRKECPPTFVRVPITVSPLGARCLMEKCRYDPGIGQFVHREGGDVFDEDTDVIETVEFDCSLEKEAAFARTLNGGTDPDKDPSAFLHPKHVVDGNEGRAYFARLFFPYRRLTGVKQLLQAVKRGMHSDLRDKFVALPAALQAQILQEVPVNDCRYLRWLCYGEQR